MAKGLLERIRDTLKVSILAIEYSGYGLFDGETSAE